MHWSSSSTEAEKKRDIEIRLMQVRILYSKITGSFLPSLKKVKAAIMAKMPFLLK